MDEQAFASTAGSFRHHYGDGYLHLYQPSSGVSYYSIYEQFIFHTSHSASTGHGWLNNVVGTFVTPLNGVSNDEAKRLHPGRQHAGILKR